MTQHDVVLDDCVSTSDCCDGDGGDNLEGQHTEVELDGDELAGPAIAVAAAFVVAPIFVNDAASERI